MQLKNELCIHAMGSGVSAQMVGRAGRGRAGRELSRDRISALCRVHERVVCLHVSCLSVCQSSLDVSSTVCLCGPPRSRTDTRSHVPGSHTVTRTTPLPLPSPHTSRVTPRHHMHVAWPVASRYVRGTWHRTRENPENCQLNGNLRSQRVYLADSSGSPGS